ncbi:hypothetical protein J2W42_002664 [Rhizobium tibeticum]|nr:hypothetical protein [Rhizobium tibeticum]
MEVRFCALVNLAIIPLGHLLSSKSTDWPGASDSTVGLDVTVWISPLAGATLEIAKSNEMHTRIKVERVICAPSYIALLIYNLTE